VQFVPALFAAPRDRSRSAIAGEIQAPARLAKPDAVLVLATAATLTAAPFVRPIGPWLALLLLAFAVVGWRRRAMPVVSVAGYAAVLVTGASSDRLLSYWPLPALFATAAAVALARLAPWMGGSLAFLRLGRFDARAHLSIVASAVIAAGALFVWFQIAHPDYTAVREKLFPRVSAPLLLLGVLLFSMVNGALEEIAYRGVLLHALDAAVGSTFLAIALQGAAFGAIHVGGFPRGLAGVALATIYGVMMGLVRRQSRGMLAPWVAHVLADCAIGVILVATR
jgi:membrane protease YdiL (CAAX protease family)